MSALMAPNVDVEVKGDKLVITIPNLKAISGVTSGGNDKIASAQFYVPSDSFGDVKVGLNVFRVIPKK
jgi:hypothetical protein